MRISDWSSDVCSSDLIANRRAAVLTDPQVLGVADEIDRLVADAGAEVKAKRDLVGLEAEHAAAAATVRRLRAEAGRDAGAEPDLPRPARGAQTLGHVALTGSTQRGDRV